VYLSSEVMWILNQLYKYLAKVTHTHTHARVKKLICILKSKLALMA